MYKIKVTKTFEKLLEANNFSYKYITDSYKPDNKKGKAVVQLWHPNKITTNQEFLDYCETNKSRPATFNEALQLALDNPELQKEFPLVTYDKSRLCCLYLRRFDDLRGVSVYRDDLDDYWHGLVRFLLVRESSDSGTLGSSVPLDTWPFETLEINGHTYKLIK